MAGSATDYLENALLNHALGVSAYTFTSGSKYVALYTVTPSEAAGTGTEVPAGVSYVRKLVTFSTSVTGSSSSSSAASFVGMPACTVVAISIMDALTGGNMLFYSTLVSPKTLLAGDTFNISSGAIAVGLD